MKDSNLIETGLNFKHIEENIKTIGELKTLYSSLENEKNNHKRQEK